MYFRCQHNQYNEWPDWFINSVRHSTNDHNLRELYNLTKTVLAPKRVTPELNNTRYQCQVNMLTNGRHTTYNSTEGRLIIECQGMIQNALIFCSTDTEILMQNSIYSPWC